MKFIKYSRVTENAIHKNLRMDYGEIKRIEFSYAVLTSDKRWTSNGVKSKLIQLNKHKDVSQLGVYIGRYAFVFLKGTVSEGI